MGLSGHGGRGGRENLNPGGNPPSNLNPALNSTSSSSLGRNPEGDHGDGGGGGGENLMG